ncbi:MAG: DUF4433 domain-containing protein [Lewinellaceae bacterium]|nr:DUF4433 domain-containing protein [Lewinellaceae bacterium]
MTKWSNTPEDPDRQRRKQAEYMVKEQVPVDCIAYILAYSENTKQKIQSLLQEAGVEIPVKISKRAYYDHV